MISTEEIKKLAALARIDIDENGAKALGKDMDAILDFVSQVKTIIKTTPKAEIDGIKNVMRDDENPTEPGTYSDELIAAFPRREGDYLKVKKIL